MAKATATVPNPATAATHVELTAPGDGERGRTDAGQRQGGNAWAHQAEFRGVLPHDRQRDEQGGDAVALCTGGACRSGSVGGDHPAGAVGQADDHAGGGGHPPRLRQCAQEIGATERHKCLAQQRRKAGQVPQGGFDGGGIDGDGFRRRHTFGAPAAFEDVQAVLHFGQSGFKAGESEVALLLLVHGGALNEARCRPLLTAGLP